MNVKNIRLQCHSHLKPVEHIYLIALREKTNDSLKEI